MKKRMVQWALAALLCACASATTAHATGNTRAQVECSPISSFSAFNRSL